MLEQSDDEYLDTVEAAAWLNARGLRIAPQTLRKYRSLGSGPPYLKPIRTCVYRASDLKAWSADKLTTRRSTSDTPIEARA